MTPTTARRIYVASSWRNLHQPSVVHVLRTAGHQVYDFRHPALDQNGFSWTEVAQDWERWTPEQYRNALQHPAARLGFQRDLEALKQATTTVLVLPCGRSAHLELGYAAASGQDTYVLCDRTLDQPELMYSLVTAICLEVAELVDLLAHPRR